MTKSPFPGMDPYLETRWGDVHSSLAIYTRDWLNSSLPPGLLARSEERSIISELTVSQREVYPDVSVIERVRSQPAEFEVGTSVAESDCLILPVQQEITQRFLEIRDAQSGGRVVTVIEFISPSNKRPGDGLEKYQQKQNECIAGQINLVEIDLTRAGNRNLIMPIHLVPPERQTTYAATVRRGEVPDRLWQYRLPLEQRLGAIPIPLRPTDQDLLLDLQALINQIYANGRYSDDLTYNEPLTPQLSKEQSLWVDTLIADRRASERGEK